MQFPKYLAFYHKMICLQLLKIPIKNQIHMLNLYDYYIILNTKL